MADRSNKILKDRHKVHADNVAKHRKIREIFGPDSPYHPNQIVGKEHLPPRGFCQKEIMYRLACKISDLDILHKRVELAMCGWDCLRWRIIKKVSASLNFPGNKGSDNIRTIVYNICGNGSSTGDLTHRYDDPDLREAILYSARVSGRINSYGSNKGNKPSTAASSITKRPISKTFRKSASPTRSTTTTLRQTTLLEERRERRRSLAARTTGYTGVNGFRQNQQQRRESQSSRIA